MSVLRRLLDPLRRLIFVWLFPEEEYYFHRQFSQVREKIFKEFLEGRDIAIYNMGALARDYVKSAAQGETYRLLEELQEANRRAHTEALGMVRDVVKPMARAAVGKFLAARVPEIEKRIDAAARNREPVIAELQQDLQFQKRKMDAFGEELDELSRRVKLTKENAL